MNIEERIRRIMVEILEVSEDEIEEDTAIGDLANWDSLNHLKIITSIEHEFNIRFAPNILMDIEDFSDIVKATEDMIN